MSVADGTAPTWPWVTEAATSPRGRWSVAGVGVVREDPSDAFEHIVAKLAG